MVRRIIRQQASVLITGISFFVLPVFINASTADMAKYLQFLIARGEYNQQRLLSTESFTRMETPTSTLGAKAGTQAGYGLYNFVTGFKRARVAFSWS